jgi:hypothetical protein
MNMDASNAWFAVASIALMISIYLLREVPGFLKRDFKLLGVLAILAPLLALTEIVWEIAAGPIAMVFGWTLASGAGLAVGFACLLRFMDTCPRCAHPVSRYVSYDLAVTTRGRIRTHVVSCRWCGSHVQGSDGLIDREEGSSRTQYGGLAPWLPQFIELIENVQREPGVKNIRPRNFLEWWQFERHKAPRKAV